MKRDGFLISIIKNQLITTDKWKPKEHSPPILSSLPTLQKRGIDI